MNAKIITTVARLASFFAQVLPPVETALGGFLTLPELTVDTVEGAPLLETHRQGQALPTGRETFFSLSCRRGGSERGPPPSLPLPSHRRSRDRPHFPSASRALQALDA